MTVASDASCVALDGVTLLRGTTTVFDRLSLTLGERRIGLIGDNGAGKSSLFRLLCGLDAPQSGTVHVYGRDVRRERGALPALVGLMFQNPDDQIIYPTVVEELAFGLTARGTARREARERARDFLGARGLSEWADRPVGSLSQGQRQRVCLLALLISAPRLLLLDEPYASLDLPGQSLLAAELAAAAQQLVVSTHLLDHVRDFERVIWLDAGRVRADGHGPGVCAAYEADVRGRLAERPPLPY
ncbi:energy-coupling factor ABC transporter ATP-binding protein [Chitinasiproducens palmae]|uniref:Biotin transport system ATP-binding protein n=1 Tax=Chitinasiproducens palmae TaxID=1770053 RepID=A0A1H2PNX4_9BURK|nr:ABC transporter ATP-binding protein [Chitinasiproducens palmae]SDV48310.1 biotin transport system ATP-binding protein [Chitinasiproducens palmae]